MGENAFDDTDFCEDDFDDGDFDDDNFHDDDFDDDEADDHGFDADDGEFDADDDDDDGDDDNDLLVAKCKSIGSPLYFASKASNCAPDTSCFNKIWYNMIRYDKIW